MRLDETTGDRETETWPAGDDGQRNVIDTVPGQKSYTPLWAVRLVTWKEGADVRVLRSAAQSAQLRRRRT